MYDNNGSQVVQTSTFNPRFNETTTTDVKTKAQVISRQVGNASSTTTTYPGGLPKTSVTKGEDGTVYTYNYDTTGGKILSSQIQKPNGGPTEKIVVNPDGSSSHVTTDSKGTIISSQNCDKIGTCVDVKANQNQQNLTAATQQNLVGKNLQGNALTNKLQGQQQNLAGNTQQGLTGAKDQVKADVLGQIQGKPTVTTTKNPDGTSTVVTKDNTGATTKTVLGKDGKTVLGIQTFDNNGNLTSTHKAKGANVQIPAKVQGAGQIKVQGAGQINTAPPGTPGNPIVTKNPDGSTRTTTVETPHSNVANSPLNLVTEKIVDKFGKTTTTTSDTTGKVLSIKVSYIPKNATVRAPLQGLTATKRER